MRARNVTIDATILFADLRGFTRLSQSISTSAMSGLLDTFYDECANAIWAHDGILNKTIGDAVMAVFNFPIHQDDHPRQAVLAARQIQMRCGSLREEIGAKLGLETDALAVGVGIDTGELSFGEFGRSHRDLTAIGTVVNTASRAQSVAEIGSKFWSLRPSATRCSPTWRAVRPEPTSSRALTPTSDYIMPRAGGERFTSVSDHWRRRLRFRPDAA